MSSLDYLDLCRLCLMKDRVSVPIFEGEGDVRQIFLKIAACLPVKVAREDKLPKKICDDCVYKVELLYQFWNTTANAEKQLLQWLGEVGLEDKQGYVTGVLNPSTMKQEENNSSGLGGAAIQVTGVQPGIGIGVIDNMGLGMPLIIPSSTQQQLTAVPMDTSTGPIQPIQPIQQAVPGPSSQPGHEQITQSQTNATTHQQDEEEDTSEDEENSDDDCDGDDGLPVKEESEEDPNNSRTIEPTTFVNVSLACDEAGPSGLQQQKIVEIPEMAMPQTTDGDPKSGFLSVKDTEKHHGIFIFGKESVIMQEWQIIEFDDKPCYAFLPASCFSETVSDKQPTEVDNDINVTVEESYTNEPVPGSENESELEVTENQESPLSVLSDEERADDKVQNGRSIGDLYQVKMEGNTVTIEKLAENVTESINQDNELSEEPDTQYFSEHVTPMPDFITRSLKCKVCSKTFDSEIAFRKHVAWTHKKKVCIEENGAYVCAVCDFRSSKKSSFIAHLERQHETRSKSSLLFPCEACGFVCRSKHSLQSHFTRKHTDSYEYPCKFCSKKFKVKGDLTTHVRFHHKEKPTMCDLCGKSCRNSGSLYVHQKWAHYKPKFECHICKRRMVTQENLDQHLLLQHEKKERIMCAECGKTFNKKDSFKRHMSIHTGNKPHLCPICSKPFARRSQLRQHLLIHTGKRPFVCDICGKAFTQKPGLICHRKTHPGTHPPLPVMPIGDIVNELAEFKKDNQD
ncbi:zinc finger and SCAN domain-containing protein 12-like isoform X6 [Diprion similis]|uniref:zinc finger and SCAN domain-containing protein 12-like isoform X6 n=1 Tax=Diprion similis TaxID=362088 RepID=UPI001EF79FE4|nr:zinc finger and SCAN domain-containing protein 12-like isoform X6 [Diprion similis]